MSTTNDTNNKPDEFERQTRAALLKGVEQLDAQVRSRLTQARFAAVEEARRRQTPWLSFWRNWAPTGAVAGAAMLAVLLWSGGEAPVSTGAQVQGAMEDLDIVVAEESLEMIQELEFYEWLDTEPGAAANHFIG
jgi:hypothetical protein